MILDWIFMISVRILLILVALVRVATARPEQRGTAEKRSQRPRTTPFAAVVHRKP